MRIKRDSEAMYAYVRFLILHLSFRLSVLFLSFSSSGLTTPKCRREKVREEVEARRAMPEGLRMKEDTDRAKKSRDEKKKGSQGASVLGVVSLSC